MTSTQKNTQVIITEFTKLVDINKEYTSNELVNILNQVYKDQDKKNKIKKPPNAYNLFVKNNISLLKEQEPELSRQDLMRKIGVLWKEKKETIDNNK